MKLNTKVKAKAIDVDSFKGLSIEDRKKLARKYIQFKEDGSIHPWLVDLYRIVGGRYNFSDSELTNYLFGDESSPQYHSNMENEEKMQFAFGIAKKYNIYKFIEDRSSLSFFSNDNQSSNYIYSDPPFPTYIFEPDLFAVQQRGDRDIDMYVEDIIERSQLAVDDANDDLKDIANRLASKFETKKNSAELDLARDLYTIALKDGYNNGFSMILEFDDLFIDGITPQQREYIENNLKSNAEMMMKSIAKKNGFVLANKNQDKYVEDDDILSMYNLPEEKEEEEVDEEGAMAQVQLRKIIKNAQQLLKILEEETQLPAWIQAKLTLANHNVEASADYLLYDEDPSEEEMYADDRKAQDSADIQRTIEIDENLAIWLINKNVEFDGNYIVFKLEGSDYRISLSDNISSYISDYEEYEGDPDELIQRIVDGDLTEEFKEMIKGQEAFLEIWV